VVCNLCGRKSDVSADVAWSARGSMLCADCLTGDTRLREADRWAEAEIRKIRDGAVPGFLAGGTSVEEVAKVFELRPDSVRRQYRESTWVQKAEIEGLILALAERGDSVAKIVAFLREPYGEVGVEVSAKKVRRIIERGRVTPRYLAAAGRFGYGEYFALPLGERIPQLAALIARPRAAA
jgi:hypothetical protein